MAGPNIGYATMSVVPSFRGIKQKLAQGVEGPLKRAGDAAGRDAATGFSSKFKAGIDRDLGSDVSTQLERAGDEAGREAATGFESRFESGMSGVGRQAGNELSTDLESAIRSEDYTAGIESQFDSLGGEVESSAAPGFDAAGAGLGAGAAAKFGGAFTAGIAAVGTIGAGLLIKGFQDGLELQDIDTTLENQLGISPERAAELGDVSSSLYRNAWGESVGEVAAAVGATERELGRLLPGTAIEELTRKALAFTDTFGVETPLVINTVGQLLESGLADSADQAFDLITRGFQEMPPAIRDELFEASNEYDVFFGQLGLSGEEAFTILTRASEDGIYGIDKAGDALGELTKRGIDMSASTVEAYQAAGLNADEMAAKIVAGGDTAREGFDEIVTGLLGIEDPTERANAAIALFGTPLEDLGTGEIPAFLRGLTDLEGGLGDVEGAAADMADGIDENTSAKLESFKRKALGGLADFAVKHLIPAFESFLEWSEENWPKIQEAISEAWGAIKPVLEELWNFFRDNILPVLREVWNFAVAYVFPAMAAMASWINNRAIPALKDMWAWIEDNVLPVLEDIWDWVQDYVVPALEDIASWIEDTAIPALEELWGWIDENILPVLQSIWDFVQDYVIPAFRAVRNWIRDQVLPKLVELWTYIDENILPVFESIWDFVQNFVIPAFQGMIGWIGRAIGWVQRFWGAMVTAKNEIQARIELIVGFFQQLPGRLTGAFGAGFAFLWRAADEARRFVQQRLSEVIGFVAGMPGRITEVFGDGFNWIETKATEAANWVSDQVDRIVEFFLGIPSRVAGWFESIPGIGWLADRIGGLDPKDVGLGPFAENEHGGVYTSPTLGLLAETPSAQPEIVTPEGLMRQIVREEGGGGGGAQFGDVHIHNDTDLDGFARALNMKLTAA